MRYYWAVLEVRKMTEEKEIQEYKDLLSEKILSIIPEQTDPAQQIDDLLKTEGVVETLRISQIDIIDILSQPTLVSIDVANLIKEYGLQQNETRPRRTPKDIEERLKPYGIDNLLWKQYHDDHYDAFDFPLVPTRSLSIPIDNGVSGAWAPNGYGKTFVFKHILKFLQNYGQENIKSHEGNEYELFSDFLTMCTSEVHHPNKSTNLRPYDGQREEELDARLIPFRQICFSVEALRDNHATEFFSVRIEVEHDSRGNVSNYSLHLLAPNVANSVVVEGNIKLPNWINSNYHLDQISYADLTTRGRNYSKWPGMALQKLLSLNVNYIEIPSLAYKPNAWDFIRENIKEIVKTLLDEFTEGDYPDIQIDKYGLLATFSKEGGNRFLLGALNNLYNELNQEDADKTPPPPTHGTGVYALNTLITNIQNIQSEINALVSSDDGGWGISLKILTPLHEKALDIIDNTSKKAHSFEKWEHLSFGQRNDLIFQTTLAQYQYCYNTNNTKEQVVLVIDEPEVGRSESWVNQLMHKLSTHISTHSILILSHRGMVLESINSSGEYQIMHTAKPDIDEVDEETYKDYGTLQSKLSTKAKQSFALINAFVDHTNPMGWKRYWGVNIPQTITPSEEWMETKAVENQWILKPTCIAESEYTSIKQFVNQIEGHYFLSNQELFWNLWNGRIWRSSIANFEFMVHGWREYEVVDHGDDILESRIKGIHSGGLGLPRTPKLNFLLTHLPIQYQKGSKEAHTTYRNKTLKELALTNGLKISNNRISNVRKIIALTEQQEDGADLFSTNLQMFIAGLKVRLDNPHVNIKHPTKDALRTYILQLENQLTNNPLITQLERQDEINARLPQTGPDQQFTEEGFFGYLKTLGVKMPEQMAQESSENPTSITDFEETTLENLTDLLDHDLLTRIHNLKEKVLYQKVDKDPLAEHAKILSKYRSKFLTTAKNFSLPDEVKVALRLRDKEKHPTQANFDTTKYRWTQKTLIASITEAEINDYAEEFVLHLASRYADKTDLDPEENIWIRADAFKKAAREIADRDVSSRIYDDFDDECGQFMLIRADIHGYSCLTCENMYDEKKFLI
jgi:hypothetical protein